MSVITNLQLFEKNMTAMRDPRIYENNEHPSAEEILKCISPTWDINRPTKDGWYLYKEGDGPEPVLVSKNATKVGVCDFENVDDIRDYHGEWCYLEELA